MEAIRTFHTGVSEDFLLTEEKFKALRDRLLKSAADFYGKLGALLGRETDIASRRALAASNFELAKLTGKVGRSADALAAHRAVAGGAARRWRPSPGPTPRRRPKSAGASPRSRPCSTRRGRRTRRRRPTGGRSRCWRARQGPTRRRGRRWRTVGRGWAGSFRTGRHAEALAAYRLARADQEALAAAPGAADDARRDLALTVSRTGIVLHQMGKPAEAEAELRRALALYRGLAEAPAASPELPPRSGERPQQPRHPDERQGKLAEAEAEYRRALAIRRELVQNNPGVSTSAAAWRTATSTSAGCWTGRARSRRRRPSTDRRWRSVGSWSRTTPPSADSPAAWPASTTTSPGCWKTGRSSEAEAEYRQGLAIYRKLAQDHPAVTEFRSRLAFIRDDFAWLLSQYGPSIGSGRPSTTRCWRLSGAGRRQPRPLRLRYRLGISLNGFGLVFNGRARPQRPRTSSARRWRSSRNWSKPTPPSPISETFWRTATTTSVTCCRTRAGHRRPRPSTSGPCRIGRSWPTTIRPSPNSRSPWRTASPRAVGRSRRPGASTTRSATTPGRGDPAKARRAGLGDR